MRIQRPLLIRYSFVFILIFLINTSLPGQSKNNYIIKNSLTMTFLEDIGVTRDNLVSINVYDTSRIFSVNLINPAFIFGSGPGSHHEIELSRLTFSKNKVTITIQHDSMIQTGRIQHFDEKTFLLSVAYFYNHRFNRTPKPLEFFLGTGVSYSRNSSAKIPVSEQIYPWFTRKTNKHQFDILLRPKVMYHLSGKFVADLNVGISVYQYYTHSYTNEGSIFTLQPDQVRLKRDEFFAQMFRVSIGIGYKL